jgi:hypothetical protein
MKKVKYLEWEINFENPSIVEAYIKNTNRLQGVLHKMTTQNIWFWRQQNTFLNIISLKEVIEKEKELRELNKIKELKK